MNRCDLKKIIREEIENYYKSRNENIKENLGLKNGTKVLFVNNKNQLVSGTIVDEVGYDQYMIKDDKTGNTQVLKKGKRAKSGSHFQIREQKSTKDIHKLIDEM